MTEHTDAAAYMVAPRHTTWTIPPTTTSLVITYANRPSVPGLINSTKKYKHDRFVFYVDVRNDETLAIQRKRNEYTFPVDFGRDFFSLLDQPLQI